MNEEHGYWREVAALFGKPMFFGEIGCASATGAAMKPWNWSFPGSRFDPDEQARFFAAERCPLCRVA